MIDWARVGELVDEIGAEDFGEVVELFLDEVESAIKLLASSDEDAIAVEEQMHFLKGAALNLGFEDLAKLCIEGEKSAAAGRPGAISVAQVRTTYEASRNQFERELPEKIAA